MSNVSPTPPDPGPQPPRDPRYDLVRHILGERHPGLWVLAYLVVVLAFALAMAWVLAPHLGDVVALLGGGTVAGGGIGLLAAVRRRKRRRDDGDDDEEDDEEDDS